jgi:hypothetical protein
MAKAATAAVPESAVQFAIDAELFQKLQVRGRVVVILGPAGPGKGPFPIGIPADLRILAKLDPKALDRAGLAPVLAPKRGM